MDGEVGIGRMPPLVVDLDPPRPKVVQALFAALAIVLFAGNAVLVARGTGTWFAFVVSWSMLGGGIWWTWRRRREQRVWGPIRCRIVLPKASPTEDPDADLVLGPESARLVRGRVDRPKKGSFTVEWADVDRVVVSGRPSAPVVELESGGEVRVRLRPILSAAEIESRLRPLDRSQGLIPRSTTRSWFR